MVIRAKTFAQGHKWSKTAGSIDFESSNVFKDSVSSGKKNKVRTSSDRQLIGLMSPDVSANKTHDELRSSLKSSAFKA